MVRVDGLQTMSNSSLSSESNFAKTRSNPENSEIVVLRMKSDPSCLVLTLFIYHNCPQPARNKPALCLRVPSHGLTRGKITVTHGLFWLIPYTTEELHDSEKPIKYMHILNI